MNQKTIEQSRGEAADAKQIKNQQALERTSGITLTLQDHKFATGNAEIQRLLIDDCDTCD